LRRTNAKFTKRFQFIEAAALESDAGIENMSLDDMEALWVAAKRVKLSVL